MRRILPLMMLVAGIPMWALTIKLASVAPVGSPWDNVLRSMGAEWSRVTGGQVELRVYMGGVAGDEPDMLRKIRIGELQAAAVSSLALNQISPDILALSVPFLIHTEAELDYVLGETRPQFMNDLESHGIHVLALSKVGWVHFFSRRPAIVPADLKKQKLAVNTGESELVSAWTGLGFDVVPLGISDTVVGLQSGMVDAAYGTPLLAAGYQWFASANHMSTLRVAPVIGAIIMSSRTWAQVPEAFRAPMLEAVARADRRLYEETAALEEQATQVMKKHGLVIDDVPPAAEALWQAEMDRGFRLVVGKTFSRAIYDRITALLQEFRSGKPAKVTP